MVLHHNVHYGITSQCAGGGSSCNLNLIPNPISYCMAQITIEVYIFKATLSKPEFASFGKLSQRSTAERAQVHSIIGGCV